MVQQEQLESVSKKLRSTKESKVTSTDSSVVQEFRVKVTSPSLILTPGAAAIQHSLASHGLRIHPDCTIEVEQV